MQISPKDTQKRPDILNNHYMTVFRYGVAACATAWISTSLTVWMAPLWTGLEHATPASQHERIEHAPLERDFMFQEILTAMVFALLLQAARDLKKSSYWLKLRQYFSSLIHVKAPAQDPFHSS